METAKELEILVEHYDKIKWKKTKNLKDPILSTPDYISFVENDILAIFESEFENISKLLSSYDIAGSSEVVAENVAKTMRKLMILYESTNAMVVNPECEAIHDELIKELRDRIDDIVSIGTLLTDLGEKSLNHNQQFEFEKSNFERKHYGFSRLRFSLNRLKLINNKPRGKPILDQVGSKLWRHFNKVLIILIIFSVLFYFFFRNYIISYDYYLKFLSWIIFLLWNPYWFGRAVPIRYRTIIPLMVLGIISICFSYGLAKGALILLVLLGYPLFEIFSSDKKRIERNHNEIRKRLFTPMLISLILVFIITQEPIWLVGFAVWIIWMYTSNISVKYFRPTFDTISKTGKDELIKDPWVFASLLFSCIFIISNGFSETTNEFLRSLYLASAQIALTLVGFLLALQAVMSNVSLKSVSEKQKIFEIEMILRSMEGLKGFLIVFISLFIVSLLGAFSTKSTNGNELKLTISWLLAPTGLGIDNALIFYKIIIFTCFITLISLNIAYLIYFFYSSSLFILPFQLVLFSRSVLIEKFSSPSNTAVLEKNIKDAFATEPKLNGRVIRELLINEIDEGLFANCTFEVIFPKKLDLINLSLVVGDILIKKMSFSKIFVGAMSNQGSLDLIYVFKMELNKEKLDFLEAQNGLDKEYKFDQLGGTIWSPAYPGNQIV